MYIRPKIVLNIQKEAYNILNMSASTNAHVSCSPRAYFRKRWWGATRGPGRPGCIVCSSTVLLCPPATLALGRMGPTGCLLTRRSLPSHQVCCELGERFHILTLLQTLYAASELQWRLSATQHLGFS